MKFLPLFQAGIVFAGLATAVQPRSLAKRDTISDILTDIEDAITCAACEVTNDSILDRLVLMAFADLPCSPTSSRPSG